MGNERLQLFNKPWIKTITFWIAFWLIQSVLMSGGKHINFYLTKNIAIVGLQAVVVYINLKVLFPRLFLKKQFLFYILSSLSLIYIVFKVSFFFIELAFSSWSIQSNYNGIVFATDFWRILSGSSFYSLALVCSTLYQLLLINRKLEKSQEEQSDNSNDIIQIKEGNTAHFVNIDDILYIKGLREYVQWKTKEKKIIALQSLKSIEDELSDQGFVRVHKSYIINSSKITSISSKEVQILNESIPIGKTYRSNLQL